MTAVVADGSITSGLRSDYLYNMNKSALSSFNLKNAGASDDTGDSTRGGSGGSFGVDNDTNQWLFSDRALDSASWPTTHDATNWSALQKSIANHHPVVSGSCRSVDTTSSPASHQHLPASSQWLHPSTMPPLDTQWQQANDPGTAFRYDTAFDHSPQHHFNHSSPTSYDSVSSTSQSTLSVPDPGYTTTGNLWHRRLTGKPVSLDNTDSIGALKGSPLKQSLYGGSISKAPQHPNARSHPLPSNIYGHFDSPRSREDNLSNSAMNPDSWSIDPHLCSTGQPNWTNTALTQSPLGYNPSMLQQPQHWMQRDRVHSRQSSHDNNSPHTPASGEVSHPPSLINSSGLSLNSPPSPEYENSPRIRLERSFADDAGDSGQEDGTAHISKQQRRSAKKSSKKDLFRDDSSYAALSRSSAAATAASDATVKKNISKVIVDKFGAIDESSHCTEVGDGKETRHLCPHPGCDKHFSTSGHARRHSRIHASLRPFQCPHLDCDATFTRRDNCSQHQKSRHRSQLIAHRITKDH